MCGLFAVFSFSCDLDIDQGMLDATELANHRGPDNVGTFADKRVFLGHTRLSILGVGDGADQPYSYERLHMIYNGEIFNYVELREQLKQLGYSFSTSSDTEVVLKAFHCWGEECFDKFNGMWSLVIYNSEEKSIVISRDRFGQKPLFYLFADNKMYIASEVQQLYKYANGAPDYELIQRFLKEGLYESNGRTFFEGIFEYPQSHYTRVSEHGNIETIRYWDYWCGQVSNFTPSDTVEFEELLDDSVQLRLRTEVPFGLLLSGGIDSTLIGAYLRKHEKGSSNPLAFNYSSEDGDDELDYARIVAERLDFQLKVAKHSESFLEYRERLNRLVTHLGRGHSSPAIVSVDYLYELAAKEGVKVVLDGQGADELLAGYKNYYVELIPWYLATGRWRQAYLCVKDQIQFGFLNSVLIGLRNILPNSLKKVGRYLYGYERLFSDYPGVVLANPIPETEVDGENGNYLNRHLIRHHKHGLSNLLFYSDIAAMNNSVENRSPFMDHRLIEYAFKKDDQLKLKDAVNKYVLRHTEAYKRHADVLDRKKIGFSSGISNKFLSSMLDELSESPINDWPIFSSKYSDFLRRSKSKPAGYERLIFRLYQVHLWSKSFSR